MTHILKCLAVICAATPLAAQEPGLTIRINLDPSVSERLIAMGEWVSLSAFYFGQPARKDVPLDELGQVYLGGEELRLYPVSQTIRLNGLLQGTPDDWTAEPYVNVNVYTSRFTDENNLINCGIVDDTIAVVIASENVIDCVWLGE